MIHIKYVCKACGKTYIRKPWAIKHSLYNAGHYIDEIEIKENAKIELDDILAKLNRFTLKVSLLERQIKKMEVNGIPNKPGNEMMDVRDLLESVDESFLNHQTIYCPTIDLIQ